ncbi:MAG: RDD family protein [Oscillospiraceae bacterium]|nr:RDD family protein [Oscillospiraceae bacterium]
MPDKTIKSYDPQTGAPIYEDGTRGAPRLSAAELEAIAAQAADASASPPEPEKTEAPAERDDTVPTLGEMIDTLNLLVPDYTSENMSAASPLPDAAVASSAALTAKAFYDARQSALEGGETQGAPQSAEMPAAAQSAATASPASSAQIPYSRRGYSAPRKSYAPAPPQPQEGGDFAPEDCAGFFTRFFAFLLDCLVAGIMALIVNGLLGLALGSALDEYVLFSIRLRGVISWLVSALYFVLLTGFTGMTAGKRLLRIKVLSADGAKAGWWSVIYRETIGRYLSSLLGIGYLVLAFDRRHRGFHDMLADTRVVLCR